MWSRGGGVGQEKVDRLQRPTRLGRSFKFKFKVGAAAALAGLAAEGAAAGELQPRQLRQALAQTQLSTEKTFSANFRGVLILRYQGTKLVWLISKEALTYALTVFPVLVEPSHRQL